MHLYCFLLDTQYNFSAKPSKNFLGQDFLVFQRRISERKFWHRNERKIIYLNENIFFFTKSKPALCYATLKEGIMQKQNDESKDDFENLALVFHSV